MLRSVSTSIPLLLVAAGAWAAGCGGDSGTTTGSTSSSGAGGGSLTVEDIMASLPKSCAFTCTEPCAEPDKAYDCPTVKAWSSLPHDVACGPWDEKYPTVVKGKCSASVPTGEAARKTGPFPGGLVLPDGHRITPLPPPATEFVFHESDLVGTWPMSIAPIPGTRLAIVTDGGIDDNALRLIDLDALAAGSDPVAAYVPFHQPSSIFYGIAYVAPSRVFASGVGDAKVYAFDLDTTAKTLVRATAADIDVGLADDGQNPYYVGPIAVNGAGTELVLAPSDHGNSVRIFSLQSGNYGHEVGRLHVGGKTSTAPTTFFDLRLDPFDPAGTTFYATDIGDNQLVEIDAAKKKIARTLPLGKNPAQMVFFDATKMLVSESDVDHVAVVDRAAWHVVADVPIESDTAPHGFSPSALAYDATNLRLYATLAGINAVEAFDVSASGVPMPAGRIPASWWPSGVLVDTDGSIAIINGKGHGTGTDMMQYPWAEGPITQLMHGSIAYVPEASLGDLTAATAAVLANLDIKDLAGKSEVTCPSGADDFPIPKTNTEGASKIIKHVILVVRENKTYDGVLGDVPGADGDPKLIMASNESTQAKIWPNARALVKAFTNFDNFYTDAEQSIQGHTWTVYGRTTDYMERTWLSIWGRATRSVTTTVTPEDMPEEQGVFTWFKKEHVGIDDMGEIIGGGELDAKYPGLVITQDLPDVDKACYMAGRIRLLCDLKPFTYALYPDDHTDGANPGSASPEVMIAVNDEATGMLVDAISHSPIWKDSLVIVTEDDPQDGGDHVDQHRSLLFMASPWVKRGYVSHGHYDMASVYRLIAHVYGISYNNEMIASALLPFDAFTSTPDYTPFSYQPRKLAAKCNPMTGVEADRARRWDFDDVDDQPGLSQQIMRMMKAPPEERGIRIVEPERPKSE